MYLFNTFKKKIIKKNEKNEIIYNCNFDKLSSGKLSESSFSKTSVIPFSLELKLVDTNVDTLLFSESTSLNSLRSEIT